MVAIKIFLFKQAEIYKVRANPHSPEWPFYGRFVRFFTTFIDTHLNIVLCGVLLCAMYLYYTFKHHHLHRH
jgi:hypothetical protein